MLWTNSTTEARVSLREDTPIPHIDLAELALDGVRIPFTTNRIERLMGEVSKRCRHQETV